MLRWVDEHHERPAAQADPGSLGRRPRAHPKQMGRSPRQLRSWPQPAAGCRPERDDHRRWAGRRMDLRAPDRVAADREPGHRLGGNGIRGGSGQSRSPGHRHAARCHRRVDRQHGCARSHGQESGDHAPVRTHSDNLGPGPWDRYRRSPRRRPGRHCPGSGVGHLLAAFRPAGFSGWAAAVHRLLRRLFLAQRRQDR